MEKVVSICVVQYLSKTRNVRLQQEQFTPETFSVLMIFDVLVNINKTGLVSSFSNENDPTLNSSLYSVTIFGSK